MRYLFIFLIGLICALSCKKEQVEPQTTNNEPPEYIRADFPGGTFEFLVKDKMIWDKKLDIIYGGFTKTEIRSLNSFYFEVYNVESDTLTTPLSLKVCPNNEMLCVQVAFYKQFADSLLQEFWFEDSRSPVTFTIDSYNSSTHLLEGTFNGRMYTHYNPFYPWSEDIPVYQEEPVDSIDISNGKFKTHLTIKN